MEYDICRNGLSSLYPCVAVNLQLVQVRAMTYMNIRHEEDVMLRRNGSPRSIGCIGISKREDSDARSRIRVNNWLIEIQEVLLLFNYCNSCANHLHPWSRNINWDQILFTSPCNLRSASLRSPLRNREKLR
jgi:hypothetical protein